MAYRQRVARGTDTGITPVGVWLIKQWCKLPVIRTLPLRSSFRNCHEVQITWRVLRPPQHGPVVWGDYYYSYDAPTLTIWTR